MKKKLGFLMIIIILIITSTFLVLKGVINNISPIIMEYSKSEMKKIASTVINKAITNDITEDINVAELFIIEKSSDEEIITITLNSVMVNDIISRATDSVEDSLKRIEVKDEGILNDFNISEEYFYVPTGIVFNNVLLSNIGPKIPIKLKLVGNVTSDVVTDIKEYGINNSLINISMEISVEIKVILPLTTDYVSITNYVPIAIKLIQGKVPIYYGDGIILDNRKGSNN